MVAVNDITVTMLWTKSFLEAQGCTIKKNILCQDNKSAPLLEENRKKSSGKQTRALNALHFVMTDQVEKGNVVIEHCPTDDVTGDCMTKPLQGGKFCKCLLMTFLAMPIKTID